MDASIQFYPLLHLKCIFLNQFHPVLPPLLEQTEKGQTSEELTFMFISCWVITFNIQNPFLSLSHQHIRLGLCCILHSDLSCEPPVLTFSEQKHGPGLFLPENNG